MIMCSKKNSDDDKSKIHQCKFCNRKFSSNKYSKIHMKNKHNGAENDNPTTVSDVKTPEFDDVTSVHTENVPLLEEFTCKLCSEVVITKQ